MNFLSCFFLDYTDLYVKVVKVDELIVLIRVIE
jgi:hypothetical protein